MGLLDWLTDGLGSLSEGGGMGKPPGAMSGGGDMPMPPVQQTGADSNTPNFNMGQMGIKPPEADGMPAPPAVGSMPPKPLPQGGDPMAGMGSGNDPGLPPAPKPLPQGGDPVADQTPLPMGRPAEAPAFNPDAPPSPTNIPPGMIKPTLNPQIMGGDTDVSGNRRSMAPVPAVADAMDSYQKAGGNFKPPGGEGGDSRAKTILGRALGMDPNTESQLRGSLAAGFSAAGNSAGKSPMQAMSSGLGAGMEGGKKADDKTEDQQDKYLKRAIDAKREGNQAEYQKNYLQYQIQRTKDELESKQKIAESKATGKDSVLNSPEQLYFKAIGATNQDPAIRESAANLRMLGTQGGVDSDAYKKAREEHSKLISSKQEGYLKREGLDNEKVKGFADKPGFSEKNPVKDFGKTPTAAKAMFDALPEGAYYINPANNGVNPKTGQPWLLIKRTQGGQPGAAQAQPQRQSGLTPPLAPPAAPYDPSDFSSASEVG